MVLIELLDPRNLSSVQLATAKETSQGQAVLQNLFDMNITAT
jgi:hypothetical protein